MPRIINWTFPSILRLMVLSRFWHRGANLIHSQNLIQRNSVLLLPSVHRLLVHPLTPFNSLSHPIQQHFGLRGRQPCGKDQFEDAFDQRTLGLGKARLGGRRNAIGGSGVGVVIELYRRSGLGILLSQFPNGVKNVLLGKEAPARVEAAKDLCQSLGGEVKQFYFLLGRYDSAFTLGSAER